MQWMNLIGDGVEYKILPEGGISIIGSATAADSGELYTLDVRFKLADPVKRRHKRLLDVVVALFMILASPMLIWFQYRKTTYLLNGFRLLVGSRTLVSYGPDRTDLPRLKQGLLQPEDNHPGIQLDERTMAHLHFLYARDYQVERDIRIFIRNLRRLDRP